jgi:hypothetical protein
LPLKASGFLIKHRVEHFNRIRTYPVFKYELKEAVKYEQLLLKSVRAHIDKLDDFLLVQDQVDFLLARDTATGKQGKTEQRTKHFTLFLGLDCMTQLVAEGVNHVNSICCNILFDQKRQAVILLNRDECQEGVKSMLCQYFSVLDQLKNLFEGELRRSLHGDNDSGRDVETDYCVL